MLVNEKRSIGMQRLEKGNNQDKYQSCGEDYIS